MMDKNKKALVVGIGLSGMAVVRFLLARGYRVSACDKNIEGRDASCPLVRDDHLFEIFDFDLVVLSPGIALNHPICQRALEEGVELIGEAELAFRYLKQRAVGVTGSNGKSTTVSMIAHVLNFAGLKARAVGNIGLPLIDYVLSGESEILIVELSSFQLETMSTPYLEHAALLNITPNHLDRHKTMEAYSAAKMRIRTLVQPGGTFFLPESFSGDFSLAERIPSMLLSERKNIPFAHAICKKLGVNDELFFEALKSFKALPHRLQLVATVKGVRCFNDSKSTSVASTLHAVDVIRERIILIVGGVDKGGSYAPWSEAFCGKVKAVIVLGEAREKIAKALEGEYALHRAATLEEAIKIGLMLGEEGDNLLLSPGCASYDAFRDYQMRGERFEKGVIDESKRYDLSCSAH